MSEYFLLNSSMYVYESTDGGLHISLPHEENIKITCEDKEFFLSLMSLLCVPQTLESLEKTMEDTPYAVDDMNLLMENLLTSNVVKRYLPIEAWHTALSPKQLNKYDRQLRNFSELPGNDMLSALRQQERLSDASVLILGVGGVGSYLALGLAQVGIGTLHLVDFDEIELSNTSRQVLYREKNIGQRKIDVAVRELQEVAPDANIIGHNIEISNADILMESLNSETFTLMAVCADKPLGEMAYIADCFSQMTKTPILYGGPYANSKVFLGPMLIPGVTKAYEELFPKKNICANDPLVKKINNRRISSIVDTDNALAAKMMEVEIVKFIGGIRKPAVEEKQIVLDTFDWSVTHALG